MKGFAIALACAAVAQTAEAESWAVYVNPADGFGGFITDLWNLDQAGTMYADWDVFGSLSDNSPELSFGLGSASVTETSGAAFVTGGGNIYSFSGVTAFTTTLAGAEPSSKGRAQSLRISKHWERCLPTRA